jgi:uncharacterized protein (DUF1697 family)
MKTYIALLRGINVGGQKKIKMSDLVTLFEELNFRDIQTYIQSGNVIFNSPSMVINKLEDKIKNAIESRYGFEVNVLIKSAQELKQVLENNPFLRKKKDPGKMYVSFLSEILSVARVAELNESDALPEEYVIRGSYIYLFFPNGYGRAKMSNNFFERKLKVFATTRNWKTVNKLYEIANVKQGS